MNAVDKLINAVDDLHGLLVEGLTDTQAEAWEPEISRLYEAMDKIKADDRIIELREKRDEFILNESVFEDDHPSWGELADAQAEAESRWNETDEGRELKALEQRKEK